MFYVLSLLSELLRFIIDHEADHVVLIQGKAYPETKGQSGTTSEALVAPVEIPKYVLRLRFEFRYMSEGGQAVMRDTRVYVL